MWKIFDKEGNLLFETTEKVDCYNLYLHKGKHYSICEVSPKTKECKVNEITMAEDDDVDETYGTEFICPYCKSVDRDAWELGDYGTTECGNCGSELEFQAEITTYYNVTPVKRQEVIEIE